MWLVIQMVVQYTMNMKKEQIKYQKVLLQLLAANIESGDFDITQRRSALGGTTGLADLRGDGEFIMKIRRFIPDFLSQTGNTQVTINLRNYSNNTRAVHHLDHLQLRHLQAK